MPGTSISAVIGLGNPGPEHLLTRHNAGFWFVDALAAKFDGRFRGHARYHGEVARIVVGGTEVTLLKPHTYMNRSGLAVRALVDYLRLPVSALLCAHDELDLPPGIARLKFGGGHGGHNGLRDVVRHLGPEFWRMRLGIGHPGDRSEVIDYVLRRATGEEEARTLSAIGDAVEAFEVFLRDGAEKAMNRLHARKEVAGG
jgi:peptidyl-tRNA hydrolase, PTH1 family